MSLAWGSLVLLILLLPGVLFFTGVNLPEQFTRETELRTPLGQLAGTLLVSFFVHGLLYCLSARACARWTIPCVSVQGLMAVLAPEAASSGNRHLAEIMLERYRWPIFAYVLATAVAGLGLGAGYGTLVKTQRFQRFSKHPWVYDLSTDTLTYAYVMTNVRQDNRVLMYKGFLKAFGVQQDGQFSYIVLLAAARFYMVLDTEVSYTSAPESQRMIGEKSTQPISGPAELTRHRKRERTYFVIKGADVANVVFDRLGIDNVAIADEAFRTLVKEAAVELGYTLIAAESKAIGEPPEGPPPARKTRRKPKPSSDTEPPAEGGKLTTD